MYALRYVRRVREVYIRWSNAEEGKTLNETPCATCQSQQVCTQDRDELIDLSNLSLPDAPPWKTVSIARPALGEGHRVPQPEHTAVFFRRTKVTSRAWGSPKIPCSRLRAWNPGIENKAESVWTCIMVPPGQIPLGVCHRSRTRFEVSPPWTTHRLAAELGGFTRAHLSIPICAEPVYEEKDTTGWESTLMKTKLFLKVLLCCTTIVSAGHAEEIGRVDTNSNFLAPITKL